MTVVTRFAPSPTGFLHIGGARTALFNWLFARHNGGKFLLRIEDTDRARSTDAAIAAILDGMKWLELDWDGEETYQFARASRHAEVAHEMVKNSTAYLCYTPQEEINALREQAMAKGESFRFESPWRDSTNMTPANTPPVVRLKAPRTGTTHVSDQVQGEIDFPNSDLDDMVLLRADGTPTYMLAVVVDDHDMGVTHIIRGDDHLTNAGRQTLIYKAMGWNVPVFAHLPLIHGPDGAKLSKRHGALGVDAYRDMGYLPEAIRNYLLRLGWSHGDDEIISTKQAIDWFNLEHVGQSPSRMDFVKLENLNHHYLQQADNAHLLALILPMLEKSLGHDLDAPARLRVEKGLTSLKPRAKTIVQLAEAAAFYARSKTLPMDPKAQEILTQHQANIEAAANAFDKLSGTWDAATLEAAVKQLVTDLNVPFKDVGMPLRAALAGTTNAPGIGDIMAALGHDETMARLYAAAKMKKAA
ncbi:glutamate--tRNA ligase [bacterium]|nr:glutamate--tRNA ligase [bacterium]